MSVLLKVNCQVGIVYSPFVRDGDNPYFSNSYNNQDVKEMLKLIVDAEFQHVATYSVGAPAELYQFNYTWKRCTSNVHSAIAAAEINSESRGHKSLSIFQGLQTNSASEQRLNSEIEVGFEVASTANRIYNGTVSALIFPSLEGFDDLFQIVNKIKNVSIRARTDGLKFGVRLWDCIEKIPTRDKNDQAAKEMIQLFDFIICRRLPNFNTFSRGPESHFKIVTSDILAVENGINKEMGLTTKVILETGWPGGTNLNGENTVQSMLHFWTLLRSWSVKTGRMVFLYEAFDNNWRDGNREVLWGGHYGFWMYSSSENQSRSASKYVRKTELVGKITLESSGQLLIGNMQLGIIIGSLVFLLGALVIMMILLHFRMKKLKGRIGDKLSDEELREFYEGNVGKTKTKGSTTESEDWAWVKVPYNRKYELTKDTFFIENKLLGKGEFAGFVYKGKIKGHLNDVAFKRTTFSSKIFALRGLLSEIKILSYLGKHENVVSLCGAYTAELANGIVYVATELCSNGSLESYLQDNSDSIPNSKLFKWAMEIAIGMEHVSSKKIIHRDLATRNVLLDYNLTAKITDFGLSQRLYQDVDRVRQNTEELLPWKWMALESLKFLEFSTKSDVWSYGVTLWEIFSLGKVPYQDQSFDEKFIARLQMGLRMDYPSRMPLILKEIMSSCWHRDPVQRPSFEEIVKTLSSINININRKIDASEISNAALALETGNAVENYLHVGYIDIECLI
ncbi:unnamed protein product [Orchesella dallaii]|uniref:Protein kinase domain-containing protein n=1 Tax=Orchesella dallaii TaxID=48710 RepID=A0ABP1R7E3_9HEXA